MTTQSHEAPIDAAACGSDCGCAQAQPDGGAKFRALGLDGAEEAEALRHELLRVEGGAAVGIDIALGRVSVPAGMEAEPVLAAARRANLRLEPWQDAPPPRDAGWGADEWLTFASGAAFVSGLGAWLAGATGAAFVLNIAAAALGASTIARPAWRSILRLRTDMNVLAMLSIIGGGIVGEWREAAAVAFLFSLSLLLESWTVRRARRSIGELVGRTPARAHRLLDGGGTEEVPVADARPGDLLLVRPGEAIPLDGVIVEGASHIDQSPITGESRPVARAAGDEAFAGGVNGEGALKLRVLRPATDTRLARIIRMVEDAQSRRAEIQRWTEKFASIYTPIMIAVAIAIAIGPPLLAGAPWMEWIYRGLVVLVIACPCALVISIPVAVAAGLARAAREGVLVKGGVFLEEAARIRAAAFDKTGTLTTGRLRVLDVRPSGGASEDDLLAAAAALESSSEHPIAAAIVEEARARGLSVPRGVEAFRAVPGMGAEGIVDGEPWWIGNARMAERQGAPGGQRYAPSGAWPDGEGAATVLAIGRGGRIDGYALLGDRLRPRAAESMRALAAMGIQASMLTGDDPAVAARIGREAGVAEVRGGLLPEDKLAAIEALVAERGHAAMVGDGINDAPALAASTLGIAMAKGGTDAAIETAGVGLLRDEIALVPWLFRHARRSRAIVVQNIVFVLGVKVLFLSMAALGVATLWMAVLADVGTTVLVTSNALRLLGAPGLEAPAEEGGSAAIRRPADAAA